MTREALNCLLRASTRVWTASARREASTLAAPSGTPVAYLSECTDPYVNLSFEDWLFRRSDPDSPVLLLYRNSPCVVIGRNQNPWKEIDLHRLHHIGASLVRRRSGGGSVYHDLGNTNYCMFSPRATFERRTAASMVTRAVRSLGIPAYVNERHDICVEQYKMPFKLSSRRAYHHGTMLIESKLHELRGLLGTAKDKMVSKGVASVPSPVRNLEDWSSLIDHDSFARAVIGEFVQLCAQNPDLPATMTQMVDEAALLSVDEIRKGTDELRSWDFQFGQTPEFSNELVYGADWGSLVRRSLMAFLTAQAISIAAKHGLIASATVTADSSAPHAARVARLLRGALESSRYGTVDRAKLEGDGLAGQAAAWLEDNM